MSEQRLRLNVGGKVFETVSATLIRFSDYFRVMLEGQMWQETKENLIFIDRGRFVLDETITARTLQQLLEDADFYQIPELTSLIKIAVANRNEAARTQLYDCEIVHEGQLVDFIVHGWEVAVHYSDPDDPSYACPNRSGSATVTNGRCSLCGKKNPLTSNHFIEFHFKFVMRKKRLQPMILHVRSL